MLAEDEVMARFPIQSKNGRGPDTAGATERKEVFPVRIVGNDVEVEIAYRTGA